jgi:DNA-binding GntR family transcriptional regulator
MLTLLKDFKTNALRESVAELLRDAMSEEQLRPGEQLAEANLSSQLKVGRGTVREALLILAQEGLVAHSQNRGFFVSELTDTDYREYKQVRMVLETLALTLARRQISAEDIRQLGRLKNEIIEAFRSEDFRLCVRTDFEFHRKVWEKSGNSCLSNTLNRVMVPFVTFTIVYGRKVLGATEELYDQRHQLYIDYLKGESTKSADECVRFHLELG